MLVDLLTYLPDMVGSAQRLEHGIVCIGPNIAG